ncbi:hypothetical protein N7450_011580 [Penicillium hetheringtonii]|uniref:Uncharacterized protein n=1 Tax=Penicillium hetheringtonii TaxID=911720 RepID=A0AAD6DA68_9EURO|nr:hypothetical protein N7450_011580 [Penicillium hetheringtonii]
MEQEHKEKGLSESLGSSIRPQDKNVIDIGNCEGHSAFERNERTLDQTPMATFAALEDFGELLWEDEDPQQAKLMFEKARDGFERYHGPFHHDTLRLVLLVGMISCITGTKDQAIEMLHWVNAGQDSLHILNRAVLKNTWIRYQRILQREHKCAWKTYLEIKDSLDINLF